MASHVYPRARVRLLEYLMSLDSPQQAGFYVVGVSAAYVYDAAHEVVADITNIVLPEQALANETVLANGILDADDVSWTGLTPPVSVDALVVYAKWTGGSLLFAYIDQTTNASLPQVIDATEANIVWNAAGIFKL